MSKTNKILLILVVVLLLVLIGLVVWQKLGIKVTESSYWAVYLKTGDLYFGKLMTFPSFGLKNIYTLQVDQQNSENPISVQKFANVFWGPEDFLKINREEVVWMTKLRSDSQLVQLVKTNPSLQSSPPPEAPTPTPNQEDKGSKDKNSDSESQE